MPDDCPELIEQAMPDVRRSHKSVHEALANAGRMGGDRGQTHYGFWHPRSFQVVQSDVICMMGLEHFRRFVMPALEEEFACHEGVYFHYSPALGGETEAWRLLEWRVTHT